MTQYVTEFGFQKPSFAEIRRTIETQFQVAFGAGVDLTPSGVLGQLVATQTKWASDLFDCAQELHTTQDPDQATGVKLDEACAKIGTFRLPATPARADDVVMWGNFGVSITVPSGSKVKSSTQPMSYSSQSDVDLGVSSTGPFRGVRLQGAFTTGDVLSVTLDGVAYTYTVLITDTVPMALAALASNINGGAFLGAASYESVAGVDLLRIEGDSFAMNAYSGHWTPKQEAQAGIFVADSAGAQPIPELTLDTILTPVAGWLSIEQPAAGQAGTDLESDASLRIRRIQGFLSGTSTEDAIRAAVYRVPGVSKAIVASNRTDVTDSESRPPHSFEVIASGGDTFAVGRAIWNTTPAGIAIYGTTTFFVTGSDGALHTVALSRPNPQYAHVEVTLVSTDPDGAPSVDYKAAIQEAIAAYGATAFGLGANFTLQKLYAPIYSVPGIYSVTLRIAITSTEGGSPTFGTSNLLVAARDYLAFSASRVTVLP